MKPVMSLLFSVLAFSAVSALARAHAVHHRGMPDDAAAHSAPDGAESANGGIPPITDSERAAAFPDLQGHSVHDHAIHYMALADQLEWRDADAGSTVSWDLKGWVGQDEERLWFRAEGERADERTEDSEVHLLWGRRVARWWDLVAGARQNFKPGPSQTWLALGVQGLAPHMFEVEATAYVGEGGQTVARLEAEYELLVTNRLILQPLVELNVYGKDDARRGIGAGFSSMEAGLRLRYEIRRELAPYIGVTWARKFGETADLAELAGEEADDSQLVVGIRAWF
jgi:copper resistance protein B